MSAKQVYGRQQKTRQGSEKLYQVTDQILKEHIGKPLYSIDTGRYAADYLRCGNWSKPAGDMCVTVQLLSHRRIRRYRVLQLKAAEKHVTLVM